MASNKQDTTKMVLRQAKTPSKRRVAEILKNGTPKERALLYFINGNMRYREGERDVQLLTKKQEEKLLHSYAEGTPEDNELYGYLNRIHAIKMCLKDFVSLCRYYKEDLMQFTNFYNIFFDYWHECSTMQKTLDLIKQMEQIPFKKESELNHKAILSPLHDCLKDSYLKTKLPYATITENKFGQLIVDMTGEKGSLYVNLASTAKNCTLSCARVKGATKALEEYAIKYGMEEFFPTAAIDNILNVMNGFNPDEDCYKELFTNHNEEDLESVFKELGYRDEYKDTFKEMNKYLGMLSTYDDIIPDEEFYNLVTRRLYGK